MGNKRVQKNDMHGYFQLDPIPGGSELSRFYESRYYDLLRSGGRAPEIRRLLAGGEEREKELQWLRSTLFADIADYTRDANSPNDQVLDVGCGVGDLVTFLGDRGFTASGIDPSSEATAIATERGLNVTQATLEEWAAIEQNSGRYGAVVMVNVLEHVPDPIAFVGNAVRLLSKDGLLVVRVPNDFSELQAAAGALVRRQEWWIESPDHINYFNRSALGSVFASVNLEVVICAGDFPMEFFPLLGFNYIDDASKGPQVHQMRQHFESALSTGVRQRLYRALMSVDVGRNLLMVGRRK